MRLGMMQPYFFPYLGYFGLIHATDVWVVFDTPQYIRRGWVNRNRVLSDSRTLWKYVRVPVRSADVSTSIRQMEIDHDQPWQTDLINSLYAYRLQRAPYYDDTVSFLVDTLSMRTDQLSALLIHCLRSCCQKIGLSIDVHVFSEMDCDLPEIHHPGEWALETAKAVGASEYVNPPGGRDLFDAQRFRDSDVRLSFLQHTLPAYHQGNAEFQSGLSIIDALMWNDDAAVLQMVADYRLDNA